VECPESLPTSTASRRFSADLFNPPLGIFDDALPDDWGRSLLAAALRIEGRRSSPAEMLLRMRGGGTGALLFTETAATPQPAATVQSKALPALLAAAEKFEAGGLPSEDEFRKLLEGSSRAGGARAIRKHSAAPKLDVATLFRYMVFNAAIGNVDGDRAPAS
jgi:serine/threonine-protein kinase HipA